MSLKSKIIGFVAGKYRAYKQQRAEERAGFKAISQREAYLLEPTLTIREKQHYCERKGYAQLKYFPNLDEPKTYSEKLIWLALHYKDPRIAPYTDKCEMKKHVSQLVGPEYCVPLLGVYDNVNDIDFDALPKGFVLKSTAGWANRQVIVVPDKGKINLDRLKSKLAEWLYPWNTYYYANLCVTDEKITPRIIAEELLGDGSSPVTDYKLLCFDGEPKIILIVTGRGTKKLQKTFLWLEDWSVLPIARNNAGTDMTVEKPDKLDELVALAKKLSAGFPIVRVDFYEDQGHIYVGELTFSPGLFLKINPTESDYSMGGLIDIDKVRNQGN